MTTAVIARGAFFLAMILAATPILAQAVDDITVDAVGLCPADSVLKKSFPKITEPSVGIGSTLTKLPDVALYQSAGGFEETMSKIGFNKELTVFGFSSDGDRLFVRTVPPSKRLAICGWVSTDMVLIPRERKFEGRLKTPQPMQMQDISEEHKKSGNMLNVKAVVIDLSIAGESKGGIDVFEDPNLHVATDKIRLFDAFNVFAVMNVEGQGSDEETRYWLIGEQTGNNNVASVKGWIRHRDVVIWPTRLAVQWREDAVVHGYANAENLKRRERELTLPERISNADLPEQITRRLPVLQQFLPPDEIFPELPVGGSLEERMAFARTKIEYYHIATPGLACRKDTGDCILARQIDAERQKMVNAEKAAMKIDVLILIDATESMDPYLPITVKTIDQFLKRAADVRGEYDLRFAISLYGDYQSQEANYEKVDYRPIVPFFKPGPGSQASSAMRQLVQNPKSLLFKDVHRDKLEAPFAAVIRAAKKTHWRPASEVPLRFIVHIGDAGNRDRGLTSASTQRNRYPGAVENQYAPQSTIVEKYDGRDVVKVLRESDIIYVPVVVEGGSSKSPDPSLWNKIFIDQANDILKLLGVDAPAKATVVTYAADPRERIETAVTEEIVRILGNVKNGLEYQKCLPGAMSEKCVNLRASEEVYKSPEIVRLVDRVTSSTTGLTPEQIRNIYSRDQSILPMFVPARWSGDKEMFTHWVALERKEFKLLRDLLQSLCNNMSQQDGRNPVVRALHDLAERYSNEEFRGLTVGEILGKRLGIPSLERTDFSGRSGDEIEDAFRAWQSKGNRTTWERWHLRACKANYFTQLMEDNKKIDPAQIKCNLESHSCSAPDTGQKKFRWSVQVSQASPVYYVPLDVLP